MDAGEIEFEFLGSLRLYKSGRIERLEGTHPEPPGTDPATGVSSKDIVINSTVTARIYLPNSGEPTGEAPPKLPVAVFFHGGAFLVHSAASPAYHAFANRLAAEANAVVVSVNYRLAPEHRLPAAYDDGWAAYRWVSSQLHGEAADLEPWIFERGDPGRVFLAGDSAGGNIAYNVAARIGREGAGKVEDLVLLHCYFWGAEPVGGETFDAGYQRWMEKNWAFICGEKFCIDHPHVNPFADGDAGAASAMSACERMLVTTAERDYFVERCRAFVERVEKSRWGGEVEIHETGGEAHCFFLASPESGKAGEHMAAVAAFVRRRR